MKHWYTLALPLIMLLAGCEGYFGDKTDIEFIEIPEFQVRQAAYVPILPILDQFVKPIDVITGFDELMYVVDGGTEEIIALDESGKILGAMSVPGVHTIAQDRSLDLIALGTKDTVIVGINYTLPCIYRINLQGPLGYGIRFGEITQEIIHPFYYKSAFSESDTIGVNFTGVAVIADNDFYVTRTGPKNNNELTALPPDQAVLVFNNNDEYQNYIVVNTSGGTFKHYFRDPSGITTTLQPPQISTVESRDFLTISQDPLEPVKVRTIDRIETENGVTYNPRALGPLDPELSDSFISDLNKFERPVDVTITGDGTNFIFIVDLAKDSLFQFTFTGLEGVPPPAGAQSKKYINVSFGGTGAGATQLRNPRAVAYKNQILYIADSGNGRVMRYRLTTDFD